MATVTRENIGLLHDKVVVKLEKEDYMPSFEKALKQYAKSVNMPGFRKGMVPTGMIRKMYGPALFNEEIMRTAGGEMEKYMQQEKLQIFAQPMVMPEGVPTKLDMNNPTEADFAFEIGLKPEFEVTALNGKEKLSRKKIVVNDKMLDDEVTRIQRRFGKPEPQEKVFDKENIIYSKFEQCDAEGNLVEGVDAIEDTELMDKLPAKLQEMIMGKKAEDTFIISPKEVCTEEELPVFLKDSMKLDETAAENHYKMTLTKVAQLIPMELGEELYKQVFPNAEVADETAFRDMLRAELSKEYDRMSNEQLQNDIYEVLVHNTKMELPVDFLKRWMKEGGEKPKTEQEVELEFPKFDHQLRWTLISDKLIQDLGVNVTEQEVLDDIKGRVLSYFGMQVAEDTPWLDDYMAKVTKDEKTMDETYRRLLYDKLFGELLTKFKIKDEELSEEEFFQQQQAHAHEHAH